MATLEPVDALLRLLLVHLVADHVAGARADGRANECALGAVADGLAHQGPGPGTDQRAGLGGRAAAQAGRLLVQRVTVSNLDSMLRVVQAGLAISVVPLEAALAYAEARQLAVVPLADAWAQRRFAVCLREEQPLPAAAELVAEWLSSEASTSAAPVDTGAVSPRRRRRISRSPGPD